MRLLRLSRQLRLLRHCVRGVDCVCRVSCVYCVIASMASIASSAEKVGRRLQDVPMDLVNHVLAMGQLEAADLVQDQAVIERKGFETDDT